MRSDRATTHFRPAVRRRDLHNPSTDVTAAMAGRCGFRHLASGRVCLLPYGHPDGCCFVPTPRSPRHVADGAGSVASTTDRAARTSSSRQGR
jgi:hypothetical protein